MRRFSRDVSGVAAIEFAIIVSILMIVFLGLVSVWSAIVTSDNMRDSAEAAANYLVQGGNSDSQAQTIAEAAWQNPPNDGTVAISRACSCNGAAVDCTTLCPVTNKPPNIQVTIQTSGTWTSPAPVIRMLASRTLVQQVVVRVR
jgi:Flp pilus assembly protein TadG